MQPSYSKPFTFDRVVRIIIGILVCLAIVFLLHYLSPVLIPFFIAWIIAYMLHPLVCFFQQKLKIKNRGLAILATMITVFGGLTELFVLLAKPLSIEIKHMVALIDVYAKGNWNPSYFPEGLQTMLKQLAGMTDVNDFFSWETLGGVLKKIWPQLSAVLSGSLNFVLSLFLIFIVLMYVVFILRDYEVMQTGWRKFIPDKYRGFITKLLDDVELGMNRYFRGQALVALIVGILFSIGFMIINLPLAIVMGLMIGVLNLVPYLQTVGLIPVTLMALLKAMDTGQDFWMVMLSVGIVFAIVQTTQDGFLVPKIMGKITGFNPAYILLSLSIWGYLLGMIGMIIALPFTVIIISYYKQFVLHDEPIVEEMNENQIGNSPQNL